MRHSWLVLLAATATAQVPSAVPAALAGIDRAAARDLEALSIPGVSIAAVDGGRLVYAGAFGVANVDSRLPATPDMLFRVGSMTKMLTAITAVTVAEERGISLDAPIGRYVTGLAPRIAALSLSRLMSHTAGMRDVIVATPIDDDRNEADLLRAVRTWGDTLLFTEPGDVMSYSNLGFVLVGAFIEAVSGQRYADAVTARVLKPLGIVDATFRVNEALRQPHADGHAGRPREKPSVVPAKTDTRLWPAGFLWANAADYARVAAALMNHGMLDGRQALSPAAVSAVTTPRTHMPGNPNASYGFGIAINGKGPTLTWTHNGRMDGFGSDILMSPVTQRAAIILRNRLDTAPQESIALLRRFVANGEAVAVLPAPGLTAAVNVAGVYVNGADSVIVRASGTAFVMREGGRAGTLSVSPANAYRFETVNESTGATAVTPVFVVPDKAGGAKYLAMRMRAYLRVSAAPDTPDSIALRARAAFADRRSPIASAISARRASARGR